MMTADLEKVIKALQIHADGCGYRSHHCDAMECPYRYGDESCDIEEMCRDALALLKEQEAKPMIENEHGWNCPSCGMKLIGKTASGYSCDLIDLPEDEPIHFCPKCGQEVKWE